ncbi:MAG: esterase-like activity of phytase family protein [Bacteroidaceae bacterium]|nr:esterase-like activity of phytase family protein [Bacteroidaceae bacterium]
MKRLLTILILAIVPALTTLAQEDRKAKDKEILDMFFQYLGAAQIDELKLDSNVIDSVQWEITPIGPLKLLRQENLGKWKIKAGDYSGIVWLGGKNYAVVSDKERTDGYIPFIIDMNLESGKLESVVRFDKLQGNPKPRYGLGGQYTVRDCEGITYFPSNNSFFIAGEGDQRILEYDAYGVPTGRELAVPKEFALEQIHKNYGFESLTYSPETHRFWCTTESQLKTDGQPAGPECPDTENLLRLQSFGDDLQPLEQYAYKMDKCHAKERKSIYAYGVSEMVAMPDGRLLVMEREFYVTERYAGSYVIHKLYLVNPKECTPITFADRAEDLGEEQILKKELVTRFKTELNLNRMNLANYEGMCLGPKLNDGRQTLLMINDSQHQYGSSGFHLKDYLRVLIF